VNAGPLYFNAVKKDWATSGRSELLPTLWIEDDPGYWPFRIGYSDRHTPLRVAIEKVDGAVERVNQPAQSSRPSLIVAFFPGDRIVWPQIGKDLTDRCLSSLIRFRYWVSQRSLSSDLPVIADLR
jgi:hypothetical protein